MSATLLIAAASVAGSCSWADPGRDRYMGTIADAIRSYSDMPAPTREKLIRMTNARAFTDHAEIRRDTITGQAGDEYTNLRAMHFGSRGKVCATVDRSAWAPEQKVLALVYCADNECVAIPSACTNVSRVDKVPTKRTAAMLPPAANDASAGGPGGPWVPLALPQVAPPAPVAFAALPPVPAALPQPAPEGRSFRLAAAPLEFWAPPPPPTYLTPQLPVVSEPATLLLVIAGLVGVLAYTRRDQRKKGA